MHPGRAARPGALARWSRVARFDFPEPLVPSSSAFLTGCTSRDERIVAPCEGAGAR